MLNRDNYKEFCNVCKTYVAPGGRCVCGCCDRYQDTPCSCVNCGVGVILKNAAVQHLSRIFCCLDCFYSFYKNHCVICGDDLQPPSMHKHICLPCFDNDVVDYFIKTMCLTDQELQKQAELCNSEKSFIITPYTYESQGVLLLRESKRKELYTWCKNQSDSAIKNEIINPIIDSFTKQVLIDMLKSRIEG
jgi:hypothetical protein